MTTVPPPAPGDRPVAALIRELDALIGRTRFVAVCVDLLAGADRAAYQPELRYLTGHDPDRFLDRRAWRDHWIRTWGARGLLHRWDDAATAAVVTGLGDPHHRPAEMCLKVSARHDVAGTGPGAAALSRHELPRVRAAAARALGVVGDSEHGADLQHLLDDPDGAVREQAARSWARLAARLDLPPPDGAG